MRMETVVVVEETTDFVSREDQRGSGGEERVRVGSAIEESRERDGESKRRERGEGVVHCQNYVVLRMLYKCCKTFVVSVAFSF